MNDYYKPCSRTDEDDCSDTSVCTLESSCTSVRFTDIPVDARNRILSYLTLPDYRSLSLVAKSTNRAVTAASHMFASSEQTYTSSSLLASAASSSATASASAGTHHHQQQQQQYHRALDRKHVEHLLQRFSSLRVLELHGVAPVGDDIFRLLNHSPAAQTLQLLSLQGVSLTYWCSDRLQLDHLEHLHIAGGSIRVSLPFFFDGLRLQTLSIAQCSSLRDGQLLDVAASSVGESLRQLSLHQCLRLVQPILQFPNLERLSLMGCFSLTRLPDFNCPQLKSLDLAFCFRLPAHTVTRVVSQLPLLEELSLVKCASLDRLELVHDRLRRINVMWSHVLHTVRLDCPQLCELETSGCHALATLIVQSIAGLQHLTLSSLPFLSRLEIRAPQLTSLTLTHCRRLNHVSVDCPVLRHVHIRDCRTVALRFCKAVRRVNLQDWVERRHRSQGSQQQQETATKTSRPWRSTHSWCRPYRSVVECM